MDAPLQDVARFPTHAATWVGIVLWSQNEGGAECAATAKSASIAPVVTEALLPNH